jgi:hypothetical protein
MPTYYTRPEVPAAVEHVHLERRVMPGRGPVWVGTLTRQGFRVCRFLATSRQKEAMARGERIAITQDQIDAAARAFFGSSHAQLRHAASPKKAARKAKREERPATLLAQARRDWSSGRAFFRGNRYWLRPLGTVTGVRTIVPGRATVAPWSAIAIATYGNNAEPGFVTTGLHRAAYAEYPNGVGLSPASSLARLARRVFSFSV